MHISVAGHHALRIMLDLALHFDETPIFRHSISKRQDISPDYIAQICGRLNKAGLIKSTMGPEGGYGLSRVAAEIKIGEIIRAIEGPIQTTYCIAPGKNTSCTRKETCVSHMLWLQLSQVIDSYLNGITLQDLVDKTNNLDHIESFQYTSVPFNENLAAPSPVMNHTETSHESVT